MAPDRLLDLVGQPGGPLADAALWHLTVVESGLVTPAMRRLVFTAPGLDKLQYRAGQDLMLRVPLSEGKVVNRRYTIRSFDSTSSSVTIDVSLHATGPGTDWIATAGPGDAIDAIGPRGKITVDDGADWHLFVVDETGLPGALAMMEALPSGAVAIALAEIDTPADEQEPDAVTAGTIDLRWLHRQGQHQPGDPELLVEAAGAVVWPTGRGRAYIAAENRVVRAIAQILESRGLEAEQISPKAYWRRGLPNAEHGEPTRD
jgi:NADPH-dependent ferric siderophore reductase